MNDLIHAKLKEIVELLDIKKDDLNYQSKRGKTYDFSKYSLPIVFYNKVKSNIHAVHLSIEKADNK